MKKINLLVLLIITLCLFLVQIVPIFASASELPPKPDKITYACYEMGGNTYAQNAILGELIKNKFDITLRLLPCANDSSRAATLHRGLADITGFGTTALYVMEGLDRFAELETGPQQFLILYCSTPISGMQAAVRADSGIKTNADLKGKKVAYVIGSPGINGLMEGHLAWADLTWDDVIKVEVPTHIAGYAAVLEGVADAAIMTGTGSDSYKLAANPHGLYWLPVPPEDKEGWRKFNTKSPHTYSALKEFGAGVSKENPLWMVSYNYYIMAKPDLDESTAYWVTKSIWENYDEAVKSAESMVEYNLPENGLKTRWPYPWHPGSIKYLKDVGLWGKTQEANQQPLLERQAGLKALWEETISIFMDKGIAAKDFVGFWLERRNEQYPDFYKPVIYD